MQEAASFLLGDSFLGGDGAAPSSASGRFLLACDLLDRGATFARAEGGVESLGLLEALAESILPVVLSGELALEAEVGAERKDCVRAPGAPLHEIFSSFLTLEPRQIPALVTAFFSPIISALPLPPSPHPPFPHVKHTHYQTRRIQTRRIQTRALKIHTRKRT